MLSSIVVSILLSSFTFSNTDYSCMDESSVHPVRNEYMLQIVLKSYNYYEGKIDGVIGPISKKALTSFQTQNELDADGILGPNTCSRLLNRKDIIKKTIGTVENVNNEINN